MPVGDIVQMTGFFTKALFLRAQSAGELERRLGYAEGRMKAGWRLLFLERSPLPDDFEFMGYSQMSGGMPLGHLAPVGGLTAEQSLRVQGYDLPALKRKIIRDVFCVSGADRLAKAIPLDAATGPAPYPPGSGIPQWKLVRPLPFRVIADLGPGEVYDGDYR